MWKEDKISGAALFLASVNSTSTMDGCCDKQQLAGRRGGVAGQRLGGKRGTISADTRGGQPGGLGDQLGLIPGFLSRFMILIGKLREPKSECLNIKVRLKMGLD